MIVTPIEERAGFLSFAETLYSALTGQDRLSPLRAQAWQRLVQLGLPTRSTEAFGYVRWRTFFRHPWQAAAPVEASRDKIQAAVLPECQQSHLVFVDGYYQPSLSNLSGLGSRVVVSSLDDAMASYGPLLTNYGAIAGREEKDAFVAPNLATHPRGAFIYVVPNTVVSAPLQIIHLQTQPNALSQPRLMVAVGRQAERPCHRMPH